MAAGHPDTDSYQLRQSLKEPDFERKAVLAKPYQFIPCTLDKWFLKKSAKIILKLFPQVENKNPMQEDGAVLWPAALFPGGPKASQRCHGGGVGTQGHV